MVRLFTAVPLPDTVRQQLMLANGGVPGARWSEPHNMHITLRFIGEVDRGLAEDCALALESVAVSPFRLTICGVGQFGAGKRARVLWAGVEKSAALGHLHDKIESALVRTGLEPEPRKFSPHVTLARLRDSPKERLVGYLQAHAALQVGPFPVDRFILYSSWPGKEAPAYREEAVYALQ
jgi:RNA 2',3'-cyclic 3'-phosphodiesterase